MTYDSNLISILDLMVMASREITPVFPKNPAANHPLLDYHHACPIIFHGNIWT
jgi:hypothetical protein